LKKRREEEGIERKRGKGKRKEGKDQKGKLKVHGVRDLKHRRSISRDSSEKLAIGDSNKRRTGN